MAAKVDFSRLTLMDALDLAHLIAGDRGFARDRAYEIAGAHVIARAYAHEQPHERGRPLGATLRGSRCVDSHRRRARTQ